MEWVHPRQAGSDAWALSSPPYAGSKVKGGGVRFAPSQLAEGAHGHVHFDEKLHDSVVMVTQEKDGSFLVKVGAVTQRMVVAGGGPSTTLACPFTWQQGCIHPGGPVGWVYPPVQPVVAI